MVTTQLQITDRLINTCQSHKMVNQVLYGFLTDIDDLPDFDPPTIYIIPGVASVPREGVFQYNYQILCMDMLLPDKSNFRDVISDTQGILMDIYSKLLYIDGNDTWSVQTGSSFTPWQERFKDYMAGSTLNLNILTFQDNCLPNLPFN